MKTETPNPMTEVLNIISPVRVLKISEWQAIAEIVETEFHPPEALHVEEINSTAIHLLSRFESLTSQPLTKEMFVNPMEKPTEESYGVDKSGYQFHLAEYQAAQSKIWFEGFETFEGSIQAKSNGRAIRVYINEPSGMYIGAKYIQLTSPTVLDLIYQIDLFNRTAQSKININYSQNFIKELLQ